MDIRQLRLFCRIVDRKSFSLAADETHITQPAASQQVRSLERELKTILLDRSRRTVVPTDAGQVLYRYGREILDLDERARTEPEHRPQVVARHRQDRAEEELEEIHVERPRARDEHDTRSDARVEDEREREVAGGVAA